MCGWLSTQLDWDEHHCILGFEAVWSGRSWRQRPGRPKTVTTLEIIDKIHELILEDRRISAKSIAE